MDCQRVSELLSEYIDDLIDEKLRIEVENHIGACRNCRQEYELLKNIIEHCSEIEEVDLPDDFHERLHERLLKENYESVKPKRRWTFTGMRRHYAAAAAGLLLVISMGIMVNSGILSLNKKTASSTKEESIEDAAPEMALRMESAAPAEMEAAQKISEEDTKLASPNEEGQVGVSAYDETFSIDVLNINLSEEEYKKHYQNIVVTIEGFGGYLDDKESGTYIIPRVNLDAMIAKLNESFKLNDIYLESEDITESYNRLKSEISSLEERQKVGESNGNSDTGVKESIKDSLKKKKEELKKLDTKLQSAYIKININR